MSINIFMIPFVLAVRAIMGKEKFDAFVRGQERLFPTSLKNENELAELLDNAGYDMLEYGRIRKTHFGTDNYFWWEIRNGVWTAVFTKSDNSIEVNEVLERLKVAGGKNIFLNPEIVQILTNQTKIETKTKTAAAQKTVEIKPQAVYPTNFTDRELLLKTLSEYRLMPKEKNGLITCETNFGKLSFKKGIDEYYDISIYEANDISKANLQLQYIDDEYKKNVQDYTYNRVIEQINESGNMVLENEYVEEDNTIVLTIGLT